MKNTERNNQKASEYETKSLLYLIGMHDDSNQIDHVAIDCFNDVTGSDQSFSKLWDVQSKNHKSMPPSKIGLSLSTLYDNFISSFNFTEYILFIPELNRNYLVNKSTNIYKYDNFQPQTQAGVLRKLTATIKKNYGSAQSPLLNDFLNHVTFIEDKHEISTYLKRIIKFKNHSIVDDKFYETIFREIRDLQSSLKNSCIEGAQINHPSEVLSFRPKRHVTKMDIHTLLINRLVGVDVFSFPGIPTAFLPVVRDMTDQETIDEILVDCHSNLSRAFFDKNAHLDFWKISEYLIIEIRQNPKADIFTMHHKLV